MEGASRLRPVILAVLVGLITVIIGARLYQIQLVMGERFQIRALDQHQSLDVVPAIRGSIVDRNGRELAASVESHALYAHPKKISDADRIAEVLAPILGLSRAGLARTLGSDKDFVYLERFLDGEQLDAIREAGLVLGGDEPLGLEPTHERVYPNGRLAVHVLGFANIDGAGVEGVEQRFDGELTGDPTTYLVWQDAHSGEVRQIIRAPEKEPLDVVLTIDVVLQHIVERELERAVRESGAPAASALILDPATGEILALANRPAANLEDYGSATDEQRINRALVYVYEPGSTFKIVPMAAALELGRVSPDQRFFCENGEYHRGGRKIRDSSRHGTLSVRGILAKSSNIGMTKIADTLTAQELRESIIHFGFGEKTGVELPGESRGQVTAMDAWSDYTHSSVSFGHEVSVTVIQMAAAFAAIANEGVLAPPRLVLGTRDADNHLTRNEAATSRRVVSQETARQMSSMMVSVVDGGTGRRAAVPGYRIAGKSGTAQMKGPGAGYSESRFVASFGGFAPVEQPRLAALVVLHAPRGKRYHGGEVAAPVFGRIMTEALRHLRVPGNDDPPSSVLLTHAASATRPESNRPPPRSVAGTGRAPDLRGLSLREAVVALAARGCRARVSGSGFVIAQSPAPGEPFPLAPEALEGQACSIRLEEPVRGRFAVRATPARGGSS